MIKTEAQFYIDIKSDTASESGVYGDNHVLQKKKL